jgi:signal transduction histidine kinase/CheY-like chemotaxis protein/flagellar motility protein MotE (MotC chaperone)
MARDPLPAERNAGDAARIWLAATITVAVVALDAMLPANLVAPILYFLPLVLIARLDRPAVLWSSAVLFVVLSFLLHVLSPAPVTPEAREMLVNRALAALVTLATALLLHLQIRASRSLAAQSAQLQARNQEQEAANEEIGQREEEIARQNEELQSQTEELERQAEELRVTNEDLAAREKTVEQLLELSRSLTSDLTRDEVLRKVCDSLGALTSGAAAAILERRGEGLRVTCHQGFGREPAAEEIALKASFSHLVMSAGQTAFLEDIRQRPDLQIPQPCDGERLLSVLATPIRVRGRSLGTVEVYSLAPQRWSDAQVSTVESVAAQLAISLQNVELLSEVEEQRRRLEAAFRSVTVGMMLVSDPEGREIRVNPAGALLLGVSLDDNLSPAAPAGVRILRGAFRHGRPAEASELPAMRALQGEEIRAEEWELVLPNGKRLSLLIGAAPFQDAEGHVTGAVAVFLDQTEHKALLRELEMRRREAEEASVRKTRFLAAVSHDIRTPANAINLMTELIRRAADNPALIAQVPEMADRLQSSVKSLLELVGDLLDVSRFDSGKAEIVETEFSLNDLLEGEGQQFRPAATARGLELIVEPPAKPVWLRTDRIKLARVIGNLLENAIKFTPEGSVTLGARAMTEGERWVRVFVADTGVGIPPEYLTRIFDEFLQLRNPERDRARGSGLGLAICKRLVELLAGELQVESALGRGTTFSIVLPASALALRLDSIAAPTRRERGPVAPRLDGLSVLLVEDHGSTRQGTRELLEQEGARVREAADGATAIALLRDDPPDVLLLDLMLPDMDGTEILKATRTLVERPRGILVLSGDLQEHRLQALQALGPDAVIQKPIDVNVLVTALQAFSRHATGAGEGPATEASRT